MSELKVKFDFSELDRLGRHIGRRASIQPYFKDITKDMAKEFQKVLIEQTPVGKTGQLKKGWEQGQSYTTRVGKDGYSISLYNRCDYASAVNYGHYSYNQYNVGGEPYQVWKRLKVPRKSKFQGQIADEDRFVYGVFFVEKSIEVMEAFRMKTQQRKVNRQLQKWFKTIIDGGKAGKSYSV